MKNESANNGSFLYNKQISGWFHDINTKHLVFKRSSVNGAYGRNKEDNENKE